MLYSSCRTCRIIQDTIRSQFRYSRGWLGRDSPRESLQRPLNTSFPCSLFSNNQDPMVRGLALRSLCSLRLPAMVEYISDPLTASLVDANSYVRKTGVMAILKMWHLWPQAVEDGAMVDTLYNMLQDSDAQVCLGIAVATPSIPWVVQKAYLPGMSASSRTGLILQEHAGDQTGILTLTIELLQRWHIHRCLVYWGQRCRWLRIAWWS